MAFGAQVSGQVFGAQQRHADARAAAGNGPHFDHAERGLAYRQNLGRARNDAKSTFPVRERR